MLSNIFLIGTGGCGCKILNSLLEEDKSYDSLFINSNIGEVENLENYNPLTNSLMISGGGTGKNKTVSKQQIENNFDKFLNAFLDRADKYLTYCIFTSCDGGFGAGSIETISKVIRKLNEEAKIMVFGAMPSKRNRRILNIENALDTYSELLNFKNNKLIDSVIFINNEKMENEKEFNTEIVNQIIDSFSINQNELDENDVRNAHTVSGYKVLLPLSNEYDNLAEAISNSISDNLFILPKDLTCKRAVGLFDEDDFEKQDLSRIILSTIEEKVTYGFNGMNYILLGGTAFPTWYAKELKMELEELKQKGIPEIEEEDFNFSIDKNDTVFTTKKKETSTKISSKTMSKREMRKKLGKDFFK